MNAAQPDSTSVFINVPFDLQYERLFLTLISGLVAFGRKPRCVLEIPQSKERLDRLMEIIDLCAVSVHDLSRVQGTLTPHHGRLPRFNMPFELGLAVARAKIGKHQVFILEAVPHRFEATTSDLKGYDALIHEGTVKGLLGCIVDAFGASDGSAPKIEDLLRHSKKVRAALMAEKSKAGRKTVFSANLFKKAVGVSSEVAKSLKLIS